MQRKETATTQNPADIRDIAGRRSIHSQFGELSRLLVAPDMSRSAIDTQLEEITNALRTENPRAQKNILLRQLPAVISVLEMQQVYYFGTLEVEVQKEGDGFVPEVKDEMIEGRYDIFDAEQIYLFRVLFAATATTQEDRLDIADVTLTAAEEALRDLQSAPHFTKDQRRIVNWRLSELIDRKKKLRTSREEQERSK